MNAPHDENVARISVLESALLDVRQDVIDIRIDLKETKGEIHEMRTDLARRPTWLITGAFTAVCSIAVSAITALALLTG